MCVCVCVCVCVLFDEGGMYVLSMEECMLFDEGVCVFAVNEGGVCFAFQ